MINGRMTELGKKRSVIREIFEYAKTRKAEIGDSKVFDFSIGIGAGYQFDMGLNVSLNYNIGLTNTFDYGDTTSEYLKEEFDKCRNSVLQINLGWRF